LNFAPVVRAALVPPLFFFLYETLKPHKPIDLVRSKDVSVSIIRIHLVTEIKILKNLIIKLFHCVVGAMGIVQLHGGLSKELIQFPVSRVHHASRNGRGYRLAHPHLY